VISDGMTLSMPGGVGGQRLEPLPTRLEYTANKEKTLELQILSSVTNVSSFHKHTFGKVPGKDYEDKV